MKGALFGALSGALFVSLGLPLGQTLGTALGNATAGNVLAQGFVGGLNSLASGGHFASGFLAGGVGSLGGFGGAHFDFGRMLVSAALGGAASILGGGKFENGAITAAFAYAAQVCARGGCGGERDPVAFVGGFAGQSGAAGTHVSDYEAEFARANSGIPTNYFSWDDYGGLQDWLENTPGPLTVLCQSAGCGTVAIELSVTNAHLVNLIAVDPYNIDPTGTWSFASLKNSVTNWVDISESEWGGIQHVSCPRFG